ncbi:hypothetical protein SO802_019929 [Lithocarpus litseifolius]|uniref:Uncharacterized protein n=1 Tax=Lithocarpus litseifolius TaxID=425828 RepID=A0AAW2CB20_9ROSI
MVSGLGRGGRATYATSTSPKLKAFAPTADFAHDGSTSSVAGKGDFVPVYVAIGMITLSMGLGIYTATQHLVNDPTVRVNKKRRETIPEVVEPERVVNEAERFVKKSLFRKVAHIQEFNHVIPADTIRKDIYAHRPRVETLQSVGIDPN